MENQWIPENTRANLTIPQVRFLLLPNREALYGGSAGGGKSEALLIGALQYVDFPGYAALIVRRTYKQLSQPDALMDRAMRWLRNTAAKWSEEKHTWTFPSGATLSFGHLEKPNDHFNYQGAAFQFLGVDEVTQHLEVQYRYLLSRLRRLQGSTVPVRARVTANPGGVGHYWVRDRFVMPETNRGRPFIPAKLEDNPNLDQQEYEAMLNELDPITYAQLRHGDWMAQLEGGLFKLEDLIRINRMDVPEHLSKIRYWDLAATEPSLQNPDPDFTVGVLLGMSTDKNFFVVDVKRDRTSPAGVDELIKNTAENEDGKGVAIYIEQEPGSSGKAVAWHYHKMLTGWEVYPDKVTGDKSHRARPLAALARQRRLFVVNAHWTQAYIDELVGFPNGHDDQVDGSSGAYDKLAVTGRPSGAGIIPVGLGGVSRWQGANGSMSVGGQTFGAHKW